MDGLTGFLEVLDAERAAFKAVTDEVGARGDAAIALADLYRALGGGWNPGAAGEDGR